MAGIELSSSSLNGDANLKGYWKFESNLTDTSSEGNNLTAGGSPSYVAAKFNNGIDLEASSSQYAYINDNASLSITGDISFSAWVKLEQLPSSFGDYFAIMNKWDDLTSNNRSYIFSIDNTNKLEVIYTSDGASGTGSWTMAETSSAVVDSSDVGNWVHLAGTADVSAKTIKLYKNGKPLGVSYVYQNSTSIYNGSSAFIVGAKGNPASTKSDYFDGVLDDLAIFDRVLTDAEINELYYDSPQNGNWTSSLEIQSDSDQVSGSSNLTNFPALISSANLSSAVYAGLNPSFGDYSLDLERSSSQYATISDASQTGLDISGDFTIEAWIELESLPSGAGPGYYTICGKYDTGSDKRSYLFAFENSIGDYLNIFYSQDGTQAGMTHIRGSVQFTSADINRWVHVAVTVDVSAKTATFYKDGVANTSNTLVLSGATSVYNSNVNFDVGAFRVGGSIYSTSYFDGNIKNLRVFSDIRTGTEIVEGRNSQSVTDANLQAEWNFENVYTDSSGNSNTLTSSGSPVFALTVPMGGSDLRITTDSAGTTEVPFEIVSLDTVAETCEIWAKVPTLSYNSSTSLFLWYGNSSALPYSATDTYGSQNVWTNYNAVYHHENLLSDSTSNAKTLTNVNSVSTATTKIGLGADYGSSNSTKYLNRADDYGISSTATHTLQCWVKLRTEIASSSWGFMEKLIGGSTGSFMGIFYEYNSGSRQLKYRRQASVSPYIAYPITLGTSDWYFLTIKYDGTNMVGYLNGSQVVSSASSGTWNGTGFTTRYYQGANAAGSPGNYSSIYQDEVRIIASDLSTDWITTEYNNQNSPSTFWTQISGVTFTPSVMIF